MLCPLVYGSSNPFDLRPCLTVSGLQNNIRCEKCREWCGTVRGIDDGCRVGDYEWVQRWYRGWCPRTQPPLPPQLHSPTHCVSTVTVPVAVITRGSPPSNETGRPPKYGPRRRVQGQTKRGHPQSPDGHQQVASLLPPTLPYAGAPLERHARPCSTLTHSSLPMAR